MKEKIIMATKVVIYQPIKNPMQSKRNFNKEWLIDIEHDGTRYIDNIMGWTGSEDMLAELSGKLKFASKDEAKNFAENKGWSYEIIEPSPSFIKPKAYADNFTKKEEV
jgi:hypothetical protein